MLPIPKKRLLAEMSPIFAKELEEALLQEERPDLAAQVPSLVVQSACCGDANCRSFYTIPKGEARKLDRESLVLDGASFTAVDLHQDRIIFVEVLDNYDGPDLRPYRRLPWEVILGFLGVLVTLWLVLT